MTRKMIITKLAAFAAAAAFCTAAIATPAHLPRRVGDKPNILFVIMDDVGIDQMTLFGYGGAAQGVAAPKTPVLDAIGAGGVLFRNTWSTPECSPSRASMFTGRYPLRHNVMAALLPPDLAASQVSPFETTTPKILRRAGYRSALFGKAHLTNSPTNPQTPSTNPYGETAVTKLGWDYFKGWYDGGPNGIDTTAGGVGEAGTYMCGYVPSSAVDPDHGANSGACYHADGTCEPLTATVSTPPGLACLASGGILKPSADCGALPPELNFNSQNGYYVGEAVTNPGAGQAAQILPATDPASRGYRTTLEANDAISWIKEQPLDAPWMATIGFSAAHTPYQPAPSDLVYTPALNLGQDCSDSSLDSRLIMSQMIEAMDRELGRVLVETGIASRNYDGSINYDPARSNTVIVIVGDNGSYAGNVRLPFDPLHSKGTVYQTGVWVPLVVSGPMVVEPGRSVEAQVNIVDLFKLFGDVAGIDVRKAVPITHGLDAQPLLPYLTNPQQDRTPLRRTNFTQYGENTRATSHVDGPCVIASANTCTTLFPSKSLCEDDYHGVWYGAGTSQSLPPGYEGGLTSCCQVNQFLYPNVKALLPDESYAVRNRDYKLVRQTFTNYDPANPQLGAACLTTTSDEFYRINQRPELPRIDLPQDLGAFKANNMLAPGTGAGMGASQLRGPAKKSYIGLNRSLEGTLSSITPCPGDANLDGVVDARDLRDQSRWINITGGASTWWDMNRDGYTDQADQIALAGLASTGGCKAAGPGRR